MAGLANQVDGEGKVYFPSTMAIRTMLDQTKDCSDRFRNKLNSRQLAANSDLLLRIQALVEAYDYAQSLGCDVWDFAVEIAIMHTKGVSNSDLRWLISEKYIEHGGETTFVGEQNRSFRRVNGLCFFEQSCFVLTEKGRVFMHQHVPQLNQTDQTVLSHEIKVARHALQTEKTPSWDSERHELLLDNVVIKQYKLPAPNQEAILMAFEEEGWVSRIDDPIPPSVDQEPKQRLRDTIKSLNRNQKKQLIHFSGDGSGQGVLWELTELP